MKQLLRIVITFAAVAAAAIAQTRVPQSPAGLASAEPFRIDRGTSFDASAPSVSVARGANAARRRVLSEMVEAEAIIGENYIDGSKIDTAAMTRSALVSMLHSLDPHSNFYDRNEWKAMLDEQKSGYAGVGMSFAQFTRAGQTASYVLSTFPGTAAYRAGLRFGDRIVSVNGVTASEKSSDEIRAMIRGSLGTTVSIQIERAATLRVETVTLSRTIIPQPSVPDFYMIRPGVGYIDLSGGFNYTTNDEVTTALRSLHRDGMSSLILDLRGNGGGIVEQAVKVAEKFLPSGALIVAQRGRTVDDNREWRSSNVAPESIPLVLLVDENTASASEIVAGALQDSDRALIVGQRTFGKGLVQNVIELPNNSGLTLTAARYFTPTGRSIQRDYSEIGRYEYFSHRQQAADIGGAYFEARTITGRSVFGGDGIEPDEVVVPAEPATGDDTVLDALFHFAREVYAGRIDGLPSIHTKALALGQRIDARELPSKEVLLKEFRSFLKSSGSWQIHEGSLQSRSAFIDIRIRQSLATAVFGSVAANQIVTDADPQVARALDSIPRSAQLFQAALKASRHIK